MTSWDDRLVLKAWDNLVAQYEDADGPHTPDKILADMLRQAMRDVEGIPIPDDLP